MMFCFTTRCDLEREDEREETFKSFLDRGYTLLLVHSNRYFDG